MDPSEPGITVIGKLTFEMWVGLLMADERIPQKSALVNLARSVLHFMFLVGDVIYYVFDLD